MLCKKPNAYRISSRGCLDSQLTPPKKPGTAPDRRDLSSLPDPPTLKPPPPPGISGRYISPPTAMPFRSSYLLRIPGQAWEIWIQLIVLNNKKGKKRQHVPSYKVVFKKLAVFPQGWESCYD